MLTPGEIFEDKFEILELLGEGSGGMVFKAAQSEFNRVVAIKLLKLQLSEDVEARSRFLREAKALSTLSHPGIVRFYAYGVWRDSVPYMVMEYIEGSTLNLLLRERKTLAESDVRRWSSQICEALQHAHDQGFVHRDLKPSNVVVDGQSRARLFDFGLVRSVLPPGGDAQRLTQDGSLLGSLCYISPEQCQGAEATPQSDIYSLACVLYECLSGSPPFTAESPMAAVFKHANQTATPIAGGMGAAIMKALAKEPTERFASAREFAEALELQKPVAMPFKPVPFAMIMAGLLLGMALLTLAVYQVRQSSGIEPSRSQLSKVPLSALKITDLSEFQPVEESAFPDEYRITIHGARTLIRENRRNTAEEYFEKTLARLNNSRSDPKLRPVIGEVMCERILNLIAARRWPLAIIKLESLAQFGKDHNLPGLTFAAYYAAGQYTLKRPLAIKARLAAHYFSEAMSTANGMHREDLEKRARQEFTRTQQLLEQQMQSSEKTG